MFNIQNNNNINQNYALGLLPQRNHKNFWYSQSSCRSDLSRFILSSENRRIIRKTDQFSFDILSLPQKPDPNIFPWIKQLGWDFPHSSVKTVFSNHIFNSLYLWSLNQTPVAYSICYFGTDISHIAYVFYDPQYLHSNLPIRLVLQVVIDSHQHHLKYCYLGRDHRQSVGYYKRNMPGYEYFDNGVWKAYNSSN